MEHFQTFKVYFCAVVLAMVGFCAASVSAAEHDAEIRLESGRLAILPHWLSDRLPADLSIPIRGVDRWPVVRGLNDALGPAWHLNVNDAGVKIGFDLDRLPADWDQSVSAMQRFTQDIAPRAAEEQRLQWGLELPKTLDANRPLVVLVHGMDGDCESCRDLAQMLQRDGFQTATFCYPAEQPIDQSARMFGGKIAGLRNLHPDLKIDVVAESMGSLVAREYVEGDHYTGGVERLILLGPPNHGSAWSKYSWMAKLSSDYDDWRHDPKWNPAWMIGEGICQAGRDLKPDSDYLKMLNDRPRRAGVKYTIVAGDEPAVNRIAARGIDEPLKWVPNSWSNAWGVRQVEGAVRDWSQSVREKRGASDGPVSLASASLEGVVDFVVLHADHLSLYESKDGRPPAAFDVVENRLKADRETEHGG